jgi:transposase-like protein
MSHKIPLPPKEELVEKYSKSGNSISAIARFYGTSNPTVRKWLIFYDIKLKTHKEISTEVNQKRKKCPPKREILDYLYTKERKTNSDLQKIFNVGQETIYEWLKFHSIPIRSLSEACKEGWKRKISHIENLTKHDLINLLESFDYNFDLVANQLDIKVWRVKSLMKEFAIQDPSVIPYKSKREIELLEFCKSIRPDLTWISGDRKQIYPYELDIYCPELGFAIEYCGLYWHSESFGKKAPSYHLDKWKLCRDQNIQLITVFEFDDLNKVKSLVKKKLSITKKIYARNCTIKEIDNKTAKDFHEKYHFHGFINSKVHLGLYYNNDLLMVLSMSKSRYSSKHEWECLRMTNKENISVIGGSSKLFSTFKRWFDPNSMVTFADLRFGDGLVYTKCGFEQEKISGANYWYFHKYRPTEVYSRVSFQKHKLKEKLNTFHSDLTEYENMLLNGWDRIWDCGNMKYVWKK